MHRAAMLFLCLTAVAFPLSKSYDVVPYRNYIGTQEDGEVGVSQYYRNTLDSLSAVSVWIGDTFDTASFFVNVYDSVTTNLVAHSVPRHPTQCWAWLGFPMLRDADPVRGRTYKVIVTRPTGAAISFAYDTTNKYRYGCLSVGGTAHDSWDLGNFGDTILNSSPLTSLSVL